jgi:maltooligosyltrehalose trehalohydrolase
VNDRLGATPGEYGTHFRVWAPDATRLDVVLESGARFAATKDDAGAFTVTIPDAGHGMRYRLSADGGPALPDPASRFQPEGVHGPSEVVDPGAYAWRTADWRGVAPKDLVVYELHTGTFSPEGTFDGVRARLPYLRDLGVTAIELMPVADFPGRWNWGYDPAAFFAPSRAYGRPEDLKALVDDAHAAGIAVLLDVVYNHFGPDGAYAPAFSRHFFTSRHATPWGRAINLDGEQSRPVRNFFLQNARQWLEEYRMDGLRLDATFALQDDGPVHLLAELSEQVAALSGPKRVLLAEDYRNLRTLVLPRAAGGYGLDGVWSDDFHHQVRRLIAGDHEGYYADYEPRESDLATAVTDGWIFQGGHSNHLGTPRGTSPAGLRPEQFVFCIQNHDQVGNRPTGDRLEATAPEAAIRAATALLLFVPQMPMLFMGQEWAASSPFQYFTDHEPELGARVTKGRTQEFAAFAGFRGEVPDPQDPQTFERSRLRWEERTKPRHSTRLAMVRDLLARRRGLEGPAHAHSPAPGALVVRRTNETLIVALRDHVTVPLDAALSEKRLVWHTEDRRFVADPVPAEREASTIRFVRAGALVLA